jgi:hypothetical protein
MIDKIFIGLSIGKNGGHSLLIIEISISKKGMKIQELWPVKMKLLDVMKHI